jgi:hypothetical protein
MIPVSPPLVTARLSCVDLSRGSYRESIMSWCVVQLLPDAKRSIVARFRKRNDATAHCQALKRLQPDAIYEVVFIPPDRSVNL